MALEATPGHQHNKPGSHSSLEPASAGLPSIRQGADARGFRLPWLAMTLGAIARIALQLFLEKKTW